MPDPPPRGTAQVAAVPLTDGEWAPFGWLPRPEGDPADGRDRLVFDGGPPHLNVIVHHAGEVARRGGRLRCDRLFRHPGHTQALVVLDGPAVVAVAAPGPAPSGPDGPSAIRAFLMPRLAAVVLHRGTWHWGPHPVGTDAVHLLNLQRLDYGADTDEADLAAAGAAVDVVVDAG